MTALARALERDPSLAAVALGRSLRAAGLPVTPERSATFAAAAALTGPARLYWAARLSFVTAHEHVPVFDAVYAAVVEGLADDTGADRGDSAADAWAAATRHRGEGPRPPTGASAPPADAVDPAARRHGRIDADPAAPEDDAQERELRVGVQASDEERLAGARLSELDEDELARVAGLIRRMAIATPPRRGRRTRAARRGERLDVRRVLRRSARSSGDPLMAVKRRRRERPRPLVALLDVSGSMAPYARAYLLLLEGAARGARAETFVFATRLTRVTRALREGRAPLALERTSRAAPDWAGGTRIGPALGEFNDGHGRRGMARGAVVVIFSDGWERGDPALVGREMERLGRLAHRIVWVNPRVAAPGFTPSTGGMAAALPHVDTLVSGHSVAALDAVVEAIGSGS